MHYLLQIIADEDRAPLCTAELTQLRAEYQAFTAALAASGHLRAGNALFPSSQATTVRAVNGQRVLTDGPFAPGAQHLAGYYLVECADLDEAIAIASRVPAIRIGEAVEVRPVAPT